MCKIIKIIIKNSLIYGHDIRNDLNEIIECLSLDIKAE